MRFGRERVASRAALSKQATIIIDDNTILNPDHFVGIDCLVVDEVQFLPPKFIETFREIADRGCPVICYGLRTDFRRNLFAGSKALLELADAIEEIKTTCYYCNKKAIFNLKLVDGKGTLSGAQVELGCEEKYVPTCPNHFTEKVRHEKQTDEAISAPEQCHNEKLSSKNIEFPADVDTMTNDSKDKVLKLRQLIAIDNGTDIEAANDFEYKDPLDEKQ